jgi:hypothetical protein
VTGEGLWASDLGAGADRCRVETARFVGFARFPLVHERNGELKTGRKEADPYPPGTEEKFAKMPISLPGG